MDATVRAMKEHQEEIKYHEEAAWSAIRSISQTLNDAGVSHEDARAIASLVGTVVEQVRLAETLKAQKRQMCPSSDSGLSVGSCWCAECAEIRAGVSS